MKFSSLRGFALGVLLMVLSAYAPAAPPADGYHLLRKISVGGGDGKQEYFDYITLDSSTRRVYLSHGTNVAVVDADSGASVGDIPGLHQVHGIALVQELGKGFVSEGAADQVSIFDLSTLKITGQVKTGGGPDCIIYDPASKHIFTFNGRSKDSTVIDPATGTVVATIPMGGRPEQAVADGKGMIFDNIEDANEVAALDSRTLTIKARWPLAPTGTPTAMAMDRQHRRLFIGGRNNVLAIMDADDGKVIQTFPIGDGVDGNTYDSETGVLASATRDGKLHIFHEDSPDHFSVVETVKTEFGAKTMAFDAKTHNLYLDTTDFGPPPASTAQQSNPQPAPIPGTFHLLVYGR